MKNKYIRAGPKFEKPEGHLYIIYKTLHRLLLIEKLFGQMLQ